MKFTRGDNKPYRIVRRTKDGSVIKEPVTEMYLTVKKDTSCSDFLIQKRLSTGDIKFDSETGCYKFEFEPKDTNDLSYGTYVYDIQIQYAQDGTVKTKTLVVDTLKLTEEVTFYSNQ